MKIGLLTNGYVEDYNFYKRKIDTYDLIICADGGLTHALHMNIVPGVALGDFDSTPKHVIDYFRSKGTRMISYSTIKNETDTEIALEYALNQKPSRVDILVGLGTRFDHSLGNVHLLKKAVDLGIRCQIITEHHEIIAVSSSIRLYGDVGDGVSLLPLTEAVRGVYTKGLSYPVEDGEFHIGAPYGISNVMSKSEAEITVGAGVLLVIKFKE